MIDAMVTIPGVTSAGLGNCPPLVSCWHLSDVFTDETADLRPINVAVSPVTYNITPGFLDSAGITLLAGRELTWHDDKNAPSVAVINQAFGRKVFGSETKALGRYYKTRDGKRIQVVGIVKDGKYTKLTEGQLPAVFLSILQVPFSQTYLLVRSNDDPEQLAEAMRTKLRELDAGLPIFVQTWSKAVDGVLFGSRMATVSLGVLGSLARCCPSRASLAWPRTPSAGAKRSWVFAWPWAHGGTKCCRPRWVAP